MWEGKKNKQKWKLKRKNDEWKEEEHDNRREQSKDEELNENGKLKFFQSSYFLFSYDVSSVEVDGDRKAAPFCC